MLAFGRTLIYVVEIENWTVHVHDVRRRCGLFVKLHWPLVNYCIQHSRTWVRKFYTS